MEYKLTLTEKTKHKKKKIKELFKAVETEAELTAEETRVLKFVKKLVILLATII